jgi:hypothetical protein
MTRRGAIIAALLAPAGVRGQQSQQTLLHIELPADENAWAMSVSYKGRTVKLTSEEVMKALEGK